jgi:arabinofuranan 3-O-arabinosyltransferase
VTGGVPELGTQTLRVRTRNGTSSSVKIDPGETRQLLLPPGAPIRELRIEEGSKEAGRPLSLSEVDVPGIAVHRSLVLPRLPRNWGAPDAVVLRADRDVRTGCVTVGGDVRCVEGRDRASEEPAEARRVVTLPTGRTYESTLRVVPAPGDALDDLVFRDQPVRAHASSVAVADERASAVAAVDGNPDTTWTASKTDLRPTLTLSWLGARRISGLHLSTDAASAASQPRRVTILWPGGRRDVTLGDDGNVRFRPFTTDGLRIRVTETVPAASLDFDARRSEVGVGVTEMRLRGLPYLPLGLSSDVRRLPCGSGPTVDVAGESVRTAVSASAVELAVGARVPALMCGRGPGVPPGRIQLAAGASELDMRASDAFSPGSWLLEASGFPSGDSAVQPPTKAVVTGPVTRVIHPRDGDAVAALRENANPGWVATQDGRRLRQVVLDGWQQGWLLRGSGPVRASFAPDPLYRVGLASGLVILLFFALGVALFGRRAPREEPAALTNRRVSGTVVTGTAVGGIGLVAGWPGLLLGLVVGLAVAAMRRWFPTPLPWLFAAPVLLAATAYVLMPWGSASGWAGNDGWPHYLMLVPLVGVLLPTEGESWRVGARGQKPFRRRLGRSTNR